MKIFKKKTFYSYYENKMRFQTIQKIVLEYIIGNLW